MLNYLLSFSDSFRLVAVFWPFLALVLTLPILLFQYIRHHQVARGQVVIIYLFIAYALAAFMAFTLYPLPDNPAAFCATHQITPQLNPLGFVGDVAEDGLSALLQLGFNVALFVPLGVFLRNLFGRKFWTSVGLAFLASSFIEVAQLTGLFGLFPCSYRLFDVDDLLLNTLGAGLGFWLARWLPNVSRVKKRADLNRNPGLVQRIVLLWADYLLVLAASAITVLALDLAGANVSEASGWWVRAGWFLLAEFALPLFWQGQTVAARLTGTTYDDRPRGRGRRLWYYLLRFTFLFLLIFVQHWTVVLLAIIVWIYWLAKKRMLYSRLAGR